jgi:predicted TIM-barrel fold metal-dependent hydrolase
MSKHLAAPTADIDILEPGIPIVDSHHHLFHRPARRYLLDEYLADAATGHNIVATIYVETQAMARISGPELLRPLGEIEFANGVGAISASGIYGSTRACAGIVGYADLSMGAKIGELLDRAISAAPDRFRGVRQILIDHPTEAPYRFMTHRPPRGIIDQPGFRCGLQQLAPRGLSYDTAVMHHQLPRISSLADDFPDTTFVIEHLGVAIAMNEDGHQPSDMFGSWRANLIDLALRPNVVCKIGGLGMRFWGFGFDEKPDRPSYIELAEVWGPYVETAIELFGPDRCMMESNFPVDSRSCDFASLWNAMKLIVKNYSSAEKLALFSGTANRVYRL